MEKLSEILDSITKYELDSVIYLPKTEDWGLNTEGAVLDPDEAEDPDGDAYDFVKERGLSYIFEVSVADQVLQNIIQQTGEKPDLEKFLSGLIYYYENDAFKIWK